MKRVVLLAVAAFLAASCMIDDGEKSPRNTDYMSGLASVMVWDMVYNSLEILEDSLSVDSDYIHVEKIAGQDSVWKITFLEGNDIVAYRRYKTFSATLEMALQPERISDRPVWSVTVDVSFADRLGYDATVKSQIPMECYREITGEIGGHAYYEFHVNGKVQLVTYYGGRELDSMEVDCKTGADECSLI